MPALNLPEDFPVPVAAFLAALVGTPDEVWSKLISLTHSNEKRMGFEWRAALEELKRS